MQSLHWISNPVISSLTLVCWLTLGGRCLSEPAIPPHDGLVTDTAHALSVFERQALIDELLAYRERSQHAIAILTVRTLDGVSIEEFANRVFHAWGIGDRDRDDGVLIVWALQERRVRIEVGYGLEPSLPDGRAGQIIRDAIVPRFREQQWYAGLHAGTVAIVAQLDQQAVDPPPALQKSTHVVLWVVVIGGLIGGGCLIAWLILRTKRRRSVRSESDYWSPSVVRQANNSHRTYRTTSTSTYPERSRSRSSARSYESSSSSWSSDSSSSSSSSSSDSGSFGGGDSGGGGASGSY